MKLNLNFIIGIILIFGILVYLNSKKGILEGFFNQNRFPVSREIRRCIFFVENPTK